MTGRPLSPHIFVYKFMYTMALSILHRAMGIALTIGFLLFAWWLVALATGPEAYASLVKCFDTLVVKLLLAGFAFAFCYHFCNGIRHLFWDAGKGLERAQARRSGAAVVVASLVLTAALIWFGCRALAGGAA
jgi:succinate dehydrogenase / fumarate reductase, cytochrome b subunit